MPPICPGCLQPMAQFRRWPNTEGIAEGRYPGLFRPQTGGGGGAGSGGVGEGGGEVLVVFLIRALAKYPLSRSTPPALHAEKKKLHTADSGTTLPPTTRLTCSGAGRGECSPRGSNPVPGGPCSVVPVTEPPCTHGRPPVDQVPHPLG